MTGAVKPVCCTGHRGTHIELLGDERPSLCGLPDHFTIASAGAPDLSAGIASTQQLMAAADRLGERHGDLVQAHTATERAAVRHPPSIALLTADAANKPTGHWVQIPGAGSGHFVTRYTPNTSRLQQSAMAGMTSTFAVTKVSSHAGLSPS